jgi:hypothetical protein
VKALLLPLTFPFICLAGLYLPDHKPQFREMTIPVGKGPRWISVADVNHDRNPDIVVANADDGTVNVLLGNGEGQFNEAAGSPFPAGHLPNDVAIADMNGDGRLDLLIIPYERDIRDASQNAVTVLFGDGEGGFKPCRVRLFRCAGVTEQTA